MYISHIRARYVCFALRARLETRSDDTSVDACKAIVSMSSSQYACKFWTSSNFPLQNYLADDKCDQSGRRRLLASLRDLHGSSHPRLRRECAHLPFLNSGGMLRSWTPSSRIATLQQFGVTPIPRMEHGLHSPQFQGEPGFFSSLDSLCSCSDGENHGLRVCRVQILPTSSSSSTPARSIPQANVLALSFAPLSTNLFTFERSVKSDTEVYKNVKAWDEKTGKEVGGWYQKTQDDWFASPSDRSPTLIDPITQGADPNRRRVPPIPTDRIRHPHLLPTPLSQTIDPLKDRRYHQRALPLQSRRLSIRVNVIKALTCPFGAGTRGLGRGAESRTGDFRFVPVVESAGQRWESGEDGESGHADDDGEEGVLPGG